MKYSLYIFINKYCYEHAYNDIKRLLISFQDLRGYQIYEGDNMLKLYINIPYSLFGNSKKQFYRDELLSLIPVIKNKYPKVFENKSECYIEFN